MSKTMAMNGASGNRNVAVSLVHMLVLCLSLIYSLFHRFIPLLSVHSFITNFSQSVVLSLSPIVYGQALLSLHHTGIRFSRECVVTQKVKTAICAIGLELLVWGNTTANKQHTVATQNSRVNEDKNSTSDRARWFIAMPLTCTTKLSLTVCESVHQKSYMHAGWCMTQPDIDPD